jgi:ABC-2 type transport system permease protein
MKAKATGWKLFLKTVIARAYPRIVAQQRERSWIFFDVFLSLLAVSAYVFIYRAIRAPEEYIGFVVLGGAMTAFWLNVLWSMSTQFYWEKETGNLPLYIISPAPKMAILLGMALGGIVGTSLRAATIIFVGSILFRVRFSVANVPLLVLVFALTLVALYGLGMMNASLFLLWGREAWHLASLAQEPIYLLSGFYFPIKSLGFWVAAVASLIPLTLGLDAMRQLLFPSGATWGFLDVRIESAILGVMSVLFLLAARLLLDYMEKIAIREGKLLEIQQ